MRTELQPARPAATPATIDVRAIPALTKLMKKRCSREEVGRWGRVWEAVTHRFSRYQRNAHTPQFICQRKNPKKKSIIIKDSGLFMTELSEPVRRHQQKVTTQPKRSGIDSFGGKTIRRPQMQRGKTKKPTGILLYVSKLLDLPLVPSTQVRTGSCADAHKYFLQVVAPNSALSWNRVSLSGGKTCLSDERCNVKKERRYRLPSLHRSSDRYDYTVLDPIPFFPLPLDHRWCLQPDRAGSFGEAQKQSPEYRRSRAEPLLFSDEQPNRQNCLCWSCVAHTVSALSFVKIVQVR